MNCGNVPRAKLRRGEPVTLNGKRFKGAAS